MQTLALPSQAVKTAGLLRPAVYLAIIIIALTLAGCTADQLQLAAQNTSKLQNDVTVAQAQLADLQKNIAAQKAVLATQPATTQAVAQLEKDEAKAKQISDWLDKAKPVIDQLNQAAQDVAAGRQPNFSPLSAFGPYGVLAALLLSVGYGAYSTVKQNQLAKTANDQAQVISAQQPVIDHIQAATGTTNPVSAAAALTGTVPVLGVSKVEPITPAAVSTPPVISPGV